MTRLHAPRTVRTLAATLFMTSLLSGLPPGALAAQSRQAPQARPEPQAPPESQPVAPPPAMIDDTNARQTRERLREIFELYPPSVAQVLRLDPTLLGRPDYLAPYPMLAAFLGQHPEVAHNPGYYI